MTAGLRLSGGRDLKGDVTLDADVCIVGTGAGGSMAAWQLAAAGLRVVALEAGEWLDRTDMTCREEEMIPRLYAEAGGRLSSDMRINVLQGQGVGGSTLHNTNLCKRIPEPILTQWREQFGLRLAGLSDDFARVESILNVHPVPEHRVNANNRVFERGVRALGWAGGRLMHNRDGNCQASGFCETGCPNDGKVNGRRLIDRAIAAGATVVARARADGIVHDGRRASEVSATLLGDDGHAGALRVRCRAVVLSASATASAALFLHSRLPDASGLAGNRLHMHPGIAVMGLHDERIAGWQGVPQSAECTEFLDFSPGSDRRVWLVSGFAHPGAAAAMLPGMGAEHERLMEQYAHASCVIAMLHDHSSGRVRRRDDERLRIDYTLERDDEEQLALGLRSAAELLLAAGARQVIVPLTRPLTCSTPEDLAAITPAVVRRFAPPLTAVHPMSTLPMGADPARSVCAGSGRVHGMQNVWVADGSLYPTSIGGPPQLGIYTLAWRIARGMAEALA